MKIQREKLPPRRRTVTAKEQLVFMAPGHAAPSAHAFFVSVGFYPHGGKAEIFVKSASDLGSSLQFILDDAAVLISNLLQLGMSLEEIRHKVSRQRPGESDASPIGALLTAAAKIPDEPPLEAISRWVNGELLSPVLKTQIRKEVGALS